VQVEINELETELRRLLQANPTRPNPAIKKKKPQKKEPAKKASPRDILNMSQATIDMIATFAFIGLIFLLGSIVFAAYVRTRSGNTAVASSNVLYVTPTPTLRPTFTLTPDPNAEVAQVGVIAEITVDSNESFLPTPRSATEVPTHVPTLTPSHTPAPTEPPTPTETPQPTPRPPAAPRPAAPPPQPQPAAQQQPAPETPPEPTAPPPAPAYRFTIAEQGNRVFQKTNYNQVTVYAAVVTVGNVPIGDLKIVGDHVPSGQHFESPPSAWHWSVANCLDCGYIKQGNLKFEPGPFMDGTWSIYVADSGGRQLSPVVPLSYSQEDREQWYWDFVLFKETG
jgi:hypothetical protein